MVSQTAQQVLQSQVILISGGAGLVAAALIQRLLDKDFDVKRIYTIIRSKQSQPAHTRLPSALQSHVGHRLIVLDGDCALPTFGLSETAWQALDEVTAVIHAAANTKYSPPLAEMLRTVDLGYFMACFSLSKPNVKVHMHVSSCLVAYNQPNGSISFEEPFRPSEEPHFNAYFQTKAINEGLLLALADEAGQATLFRIARLPVLGPAISYPFPGSGSIPAAPVCGLISAHPAPEGVNPDAKFDVMPVDICVDQLIAVTASAVLSARSETPVRAVQFYNLAAGIDPAFLVPGSIMLGPRYKIDEPRIPWSVIWSNYSGIINKTVLFDTSKRDVVLGLSKSTITVDPPIDCSSLQVDFKKCLLAIGGWEGYFDMVRHLLDDQAKRRKQQQTIAQLCDALAGRESRL